MSVKVGRYYDLLGKVAKRIFPETDSEKTCAITRREHEIFIREPIKRNVMKHLFNVDDGMVIRLK